MLDGVLSFLKDRLNNYLKVKTGVEGFEVVFAQERNPREITLPKEALTALLVNLEEERIFRSGANYQKERASLPSNQTVNPHLYLNVYILFVANFTSYTLSLKLLSLIISFFHSHRIFDSQNSPSLGFEIEKLAIELVNLPFEDQKDIWSLLGNSYLPSALYKVRMIVLEDLDSLDVEADVTKAEVFSAPM